MPVQHNRNRKRGSAFKSFAVKTYNKYTFAVSHVHSLDCYIKPTDQRLFSDLNKVGQS